MPCFLSIPYFLIMKYKTCKKGVARREGAPPFLYTPGCDISLSGFPFVVNPFFNTRVRQNDLPPVHFSIEAEPGRRPTRAAQSRRHGSDRPTDPRRGSVRRRAPRFRQSDRYPADGAASALYPPVRARFRTLPAAVRPGNRRSRILRQTVRTDPSGLPSWLFARQGTSLGFRDVCSRFHSMQSIRTACALLAKIRPTSRSRRTAMAACPAGCLAIWLPRMPRGCPEAVGPPRMPRESPPISCHPDFSPPAGFCYGRSYPEAVGPPRMPRRCPETVEPPRMPHKGVPGGGWTSAYTTQGVPGGGRISAYAKRVPGNGQISAYAKGTSAHFLSS